MRYRGHPSRLHSILTTAEVSPSCQPPAERRPSHARLRARYLPFTHAYAPSGERVLWETWTGRFEISLGLCSARWTTTIGTGCNLPVRSHVAKRLFVEGGQEERASRGHIPSRIGSLFRLLGGGGLAATGSQPSHSSVELLIS